MDLKTSIDYFNEYDFVRSDGGLHELTVTIPLCEYRKIISEAVRNEEIINRLQEEKNRLTEQNKLLTELNFLVKVNETISALFGGEAEEESEVKI